MAIIKNAEIWFTKLDPKRPAKKFSPKNPTWELQIRTKDKEVKKSWEALNLKVKPVMDKDDNLDYYRVNLKKKSLKEVSKDVFEPTAPVQVVDGKGADVDPNSIGNGSIASIRIFQHNYTFEGKTGISSVLMAVQLIKHKLYIPKPMEEFEEAETEVLPPDDDEVAEGSEPSGAPARAVDTSKF
jgi:hypothetical protein